MKKLTFFSGVYVSAMEKKLGKNADMESWSAIEQGNEELRNGIKLQIKHLKQLKREILEQTKYTYDKFLKSYAPFTNIFAKIFATLWCNMLHYSNLRNKLRETSNIKLSINIKSKSGRDNNAIDSTNSTIRCHASPSIRCLVPICVAICHVVYLLLLRVGSSIWSMALRGWD